MRKVFQCVLKPALRKTGKQMAFKMKKQCLRLQKAFFKGQRTALTYHFNVIAENRLHLKDILKSFNS